MKWSEASTLEFVKFYLKKECLWNPEDPSYKNKSVRQLAYSNIAEDFKESTGLCITTCEVKTKIKNLRTTYSQQVHKILVRSRDPDHLYQPSLVWFHQMDACLKHLTNKHINFSSFNTKYSTRADERSDKVWVEATVNGPEILGDEDSKPDPLVPHPQTSELLHQKLGMKTRQRRLSSSSVRLANFKVKKKKKMRRRERSPAYNSASDLERLDDKPAPVEDEFDIYGKYIASQLRTMELQKALRLQMEINTLVSGARLEDVEECD